MVVSDGDASHSVEQRCYWDAYNVFVGLLDKATGDIGWEDESILLFNL